MVPMRQEGRFCGIVGEQEGTDGEQVRAGVFTQSLNRRKQTLTEVSKLLKPEPKLKLGYFHLRFVCSFLLLFFKLYPHRS